MCPLNVSLELCDVAQPNQCNVNDTDRYQALSLVFIQSSHAWDIAKRKKGVGGSKNLLDMFSGESTVEYALSL